MSAYGLPCHGTVCQVIVRTDYTVSTHFFAWLPFWTERDISRSRRPFEPKRVALGSQRRGLCSCLIWSDFKHFEFLSKIWSPGSREAYVLGCITCSQISEFSKEGEAMKSLISSSSVLSLAYWFIERSLWDSPSSSLYPPFAQSGVSRYMLGLAGG